MEENKDNNFDNSIALWQRDKKKQDESGKKYPNYTGSLTVNGKKLNEKIRFDSLQEKLTRTDQMILVISRFGNEKTINVKLGKDPKYTISTFESKGAELTEYMIKTRNSWLNKK